MLDTNSNPPSSEIDSATFALNEFNALNSEIVKCLEIQYQFIALTLIVAGTFLSLGSQTNTNPVILLVYPIIALFLAVGVYTRNLCRHTTGRNGDCLTQSHIFRVRNCHADS